MYRLGSRSIQLQNRSDDTWNDTKAMNHIFGDHTSSQRRLFVCGGDCCGIRRRLRLRSSSSMG